MVQSSTAKWVKGDNPFGRTAVVMLAAIAATLFGFLNIGLAFTALMAFIGALLLLVVGVFFACLWIIPGRPRQWGLNWFEALIGLVLQSFLAMLVFGTALTLVTAVFTLTGSLGWLPVTGLAIVVLIVGFRLRTVARQPYDDDAAWCGQHHAGWDGPSWRNGCGQKVHGRVEQPWCGAGAD